jgi:hypothetical protein
MAAVKAVLAAGEVVSQVEVDKDGTITVVTSKSKETASKEPNEWDPI